MRRATPVLLAVSVACCRSPSTQVVDAEPEPLVAPDSAAEVPTDAPAAGEPPASNAAAAERRTVRESKRVRLDGVEEEWRVEWIGTPTDTCFDETRHTCLCAGLGFAESGTFEIVRTRPAPDRVGTLAAGALVERIRREGPLPRWPTQLGDEAKPTLDAADVAAIKRRPAVPILTLRDYDGDGRPSELVLQIGAGQPCVRTWSILVGVDRATNRLHAYGTTDRPDLPLVLAYRAQWEELRTSARRGADLVQVACLDHGSGVQVEYHVAAGPNGLVAEERTYGCTSNGRRGGLATRKPVDDDRGKP